MHKEVIVGTAVVAGAYAAGHVVAKKKEERLLKAMEFAWVECEPKKGTIFKFGPGATALEQYENGECGVRKYHKGGLSGLINKVPIVGSLIGAAAGGIPGISGIGSVLSIFGLDEGDVHFRQRRLPVGRVPRQRIVPARATV